MQRFQITAISKLAPTPLAVLPGRIASSDNFFQRRNLIALRELADNVERDAIALRTRFANATTPNGQFCNIHERVLVCVSTYPNSVQLLRRGTRLASYMNAPLYTLFVADPERFLTKQESLHILFPKKTPPSPFPDFCKKSNEDKKHPHCPL